MMGKTKKKRPLRGVRPEMLSPAGYYNIVTYYLIVVNGDKH